jgi:SAM-dependent methyltransferase
VRDLLAQENDPIAAFYEELAFLHHRLITETPERVVAGARFPLSETDAHLVARTSRLSEPFLAEAIGDVVPPHGAVRLLEVGCGSGAHIRTATSLNPDLTAVGLELQDAAAAVARENVAAWDLGDRVSIRTGDVRDLEGEADFDLLTLHQNIYYFPEEDRTPLLAHLSGFLRPGGRILVTTICRGGGVATAGLDLWGAMTEGAGRLPVPEELAAQLAAAGYREVRSLKITPDGMYWAFVGTKA